MSSFTSRRPATASSGSWLPRPCCASTNPTCTTEGSVQAWRKFASVFDRLVGVDAYQFEKKLYHIAQHVDLPPAPKVGPGHSALPQDQQLPPHLIINIQLPLYPVGFSWRWLGGPGRPCSRDHSLNAACHMHFESFFCNLIKGTSCMINLPWHSETKSSF